MKAKWMTSLMIAAFSAALAIGTGVSAGEMGSGMKGHENSGGTAGDGGASTMNFTELDQDGDGRISQAEAAAHPGLADQFQRLDSDGDGQLEKGEFAQFEKMEHGGRTQSEQEMKRKEPPDEHKGMEHW